MIDLSFEVLERTSNLTMQVVSQYYSSLRFLTFLIAIQCLLLRLPIPLDAINIINNLLCSSSHDM